MLKMLQYLVATGAVIYALPPELFVYNGKDQSGDGLIFRSKQSDLMAHSSQIISQIKSFCYKGHWAFYQTKNFNGTMMEDDTEDLKCANVDTSTFPVESTRFLGPADMDAVAITFYDNRNYMGKEFVVRGAAANLPFIPGSFVSNSGSSQLTNWTFFEENDYSSRAFCYTQIQRHEKVANMKRLFTKGIKTVSKGCLLAARIRGYFTTNDLEDAV